MENPPDMELEVEQVIEFENLPNNCALIFRAAKDNAKQIKDFHTLVARYKDLINSKRISIFCLDENTSIETLDEARMAKAGWVKKVEKKIVLK